MIGDVRCSGGVLVSFMDNRPTWVPKAEAALARGIEAYREAAETILAAMAADPTLTQAKVGHYLGHERAWVSRLLSWYKNGCEPAGVFAAAAVASRARAKDGDVSSTKHSGLDMGPDRPWLPGIEGGPTDAPPPAETEAFRLVLGASAACKAFNQALGHVNRDAMLLVHRSESGVRRRATLKGLEASLQQSIKSGRSTLAEVQAALEEIPKMLEAAE
jgi:hypothetical protein